VLAGARTFTAIAEWAHDLTPAVRIRLGLGRTAPSESTIRRVLQNVDAEALDGAVSAWLVTRSASSTAVLRMIAIDGKSARGARGPNGRAVHLLAAFDQVSGVVLGQTVVDGKTNEVRREALCRIPDSVRRDSEDSFWARWLTRIRKAMGTRACHEYRRSYPGVRSDASGSPRDMAKLRHEALCRIPDTVGKDLEVRP
jgi:hypothetical protein